MNDSIPTAPADGISQKMLTQTLRSLELDGLVDRRAKATVPVTVEYSLTSTGRTLTEPLDAIRRWAERPIEAVAAGPILQADHALRARSDAPSTAHASGSPTTGVARRAARAGA